MFILFFKFLFKTHDKFDTENLEKCLKTFETSGEVHMRVLNKTTFSNSSSLKFTVSYFVVFRVKISEK